MESFLNVDKMTNPIPVKRGVALTLFAGMALCVFVNITGCSILSQGRSVYDREGIRIGLETDPTVARSSQPVLNHHPMDITPKSMELLLQYIQVSGYSGTLVGLVTRPQPVPLFTPKELSAISGHLVSAFREAKPDERVSFSLPKPDVIYSEDRTIGFLFFRGRYLHVVVTDHSSIIRTDSGGGEVRDIRDTKGMKLSVMAPAQVAMVPDLEEPRWAPFEMVHLSLNVNEVLAQKEKVPSSPSNQERAGLPVLTPVATATESGQGRTSSEDLQHQVQELSSTNQELRDRLDKQDARMEQLQEQLKQLRREPPQPTPKRKPLKTVPAQ
ncbi:MAG: hypothetical protein H8K03_08905 [Nitrospira sp.]|jgi:hypothetical protein|nr:hypothetical protein [Nitrospira sp. BO4]